MISHGNVPLNSVIPFPFDSFAGATGASITLTGLALGDILCYKGTSMTQRASTAGFVLMDTDGIDLDTTTGIHGFSIDTSDNTDAGFFVAGSFYWVVISSVTIDGQTVNFVVGTFRLTPAESIAGQPKVDVGGWLGTAPSTPTVAGVPNVNTKTWNDLTTVALPLVPATAGRTLVVDAAGLADANAVKVGPTAAGTAQTARDLGASVLLSSGTGTGQLDFTSGVVKANLAQILGTALTETAGQIAAAFKKFFDKATPTGTINSIPDAVAGAASGIAIVGSNMGTTTSLTGDAFSRLGAPAGASVSADVAAVKAETVLILADTANLKTRTPAALVGGRMDSSVGAMAANVLTAAATAADFGTELAAAIWDAVTSGMVTVGSIGKKLADWVVGTIDTYTGNTKQTGDAFLRLGAPAGASVSADVAAVKVDTAAVKVQTDKLVFTVANQVDANVLDWKSATAPAMTGDAFARLGAAGAGLTAVPWNAAWDAEVQSEVEDALDVTMADSVPADGTRPSLRQAAYMMVQFLTDRSYSGTTLTIRKADGSTALFTCTLSDATSPTSVTRAT